MCKCTCMHACTKTRKHADEHHAPGVGGQAGARGCGAIYPRSLGAKPAQTITSPSRRLVSTPTPLRRASRP